MVKTRDAPRQPLQTPLRMPSQTETLVKAIRNIPDFPAKGILFRDITPILGSSKLFEMAIKLLAKPYKNKKPDYIVGIEARGFILASALALKLNAGLVPVRKKGKLPYNKASITYDLEYGKDTLEIHEDAFLKGSQALIVDDVLATGGTAKATAELVQKVGGKILGLAFLIELPALRGREKISQYPIYSVMEL